MDCVPLANILLHAAGAVPLVEWPRYSIDSGSHVEESPLLAFLRGQAADPGSVLIAAHLEEHGKDEPVRAGDVVVVRAGRAPYHLGVATTDDGDFCHVLIRREVTFSSLADSTYADRLQTIFRPVLPHSGGSV